MVDYKLIGNRIRHFREQNHITQDMLANAAGISRRRLSSLENGQLDNISLNVMLEISNALYISIEDLVNSTEDKNEENIYSEEKGIEKNYKKVFERNYINHDPFFSVSTFIQLFLVLPLIDPEDLLEIYRRVDGDVICRETYVQQCIENALKQTPDDNAKKYVQTIFHFLNSFQWNEQSKTPLQVRFQEEYYKLRNRKEFNIYHEAYSALIEYRIKSNKIIENAFDNMVKLLDEQAAMSQRLLNELDEVYSCSDKIVDIVKEKYNETKG